jgi:hypothetical protein
LIDFQEIKSICERNSCLSKSLVDDFLLTYVGEKEGQSQKTFRKLGSFRHIINKMGADWIRMVVSQLLVNDIFRKDGQINRIINHAEVSNRSQAEIDFLEFQIKHPWRFSFCTATKQHPHSFFEMKDVVSEETFLLFSPGISEINHDAGTAFSMWFLLIAFNGDCYQTYGPLVYFRGIQPFDLFYFAKAIRPGIVLPNEVPDVIESDPLPFTMLFSGAELPVTFHKKDMVVYHKSEYYVKDFDIERYVEDFIVEKKYPLFKLSLKRWHGFPHFSKCIYHAKKNLLILTSMTNRGYNSLVAALNRKKNDFPINPEILVTPSMHYLTKDILGVSQDMFPYEKHFTKKSSQPGKPPANGVFRGLFA